MHKKLLGRAVCALFLAIAGSGAAFAQIRFDAGAYQALADANSSKSIPVGTQITLGNWQQYKQFMPMSLIAAYSGSYGWKVGPGPGYTVVVGPTEAFKLPNSVAKATEKYAGQAQLKKVPDGSYTVAGYGAGIPFPNLPIPTWHTRSCTTCGTALCRRGSDTLIPATKSIGFAITMCRWLTSSVGA